MSSRQEPPNKRRKTQKPSAHSFNAALKSALNSPSLAGVVFCIPVSGNVNTDKDDSGYGLDEKQQDGDESQEDQDFDVTTINNANESKTSNHQNGNNNNDTEFQYKEYSLNSFPFIVHSTVFKTMLTENDKNRNQSMDNVSAQDINVKIVLKDLDIETFEFIRDYCYCLQPQMDKKVVFKALLASFKYMIDSMSQECIEFMRDEWIVDRESLFTFLEQLSGFENDTNSNIISKRCMSIIFNDNKILQRYACQFWDQVQCLRKARYLNEDILILLLQSDSFYMNESSIWEMVIDYIENSGNYFDVDEDPICDILESEKFGEILSKFVPFIRFDIIGLPYFLKNIKSLLFEHKLMTKEQFADILLSWTEKSLYKEKFTLKKQRFLFETNYLTSIDGIKVGDKIDVIGSSSNVEIRDGFYVKTVADIDRASKTLTFCNVAGFMRWKNIVVAKPRSICMSTNNTFGDLEQGLLVQFRHVFQRNSGASESWVEGKYDYDNAIAGEARIKCDDDCGWLICVNDPRCFRIKS